MKRKIYLAYGSNMSEVQMAQRCPDATFAGTGKIYGYELLFKGSMTGCYATIEKKEEAFVPVVLWRISAADERRLDVYEGFPRFYGRAVVRVEFRGRTVDAMLYEMTPAAKAVRNGIGYSESYRAACSAGARAAGIPDVFARQK